MGKKGATKKSKPSPSGPAVPAENKKSGRITLQDVLQKKDRRAAHGEDDDQSASCTSSSSSVLPPEDEWDAQTLALKQAIENGAFDHLLDKKTDDDESSVEEVELDDGEEVEEEDDNDKDAATEDDSIESGAAEEEAGSDHSADDASAGHSDEESDAGGSHESEKATKSHLNVKLCADDEVDRSKDVDEDESGDEAEEGDNEDGDDDDSEDEEESDNRQEQLTKQNHINSKALHVVTEELHSRKKLWPWAETFDILSTDPLPFTKQSGHANVAIEVVDIHDDLKREVAFYDLALAAVARAREQCGTAKIPFTRPDDYFAEMVKTDGATSLFANNSLRSSLLCHCLTCFLYNHLQTTWPR